MTLVQISRRLARRTGNLVFAAPVEAVYNPLVYARAPHEAYLKRFGEGPREVLLVGMNPGPFGMAQTGVPFGEVSMVRDWMGIQGPVGRPEHEHPKRPIAGFACPRTEVSGTRLWGWARSRFGAAESFFARFFVANYCPLVFLEESGRNRTPDKLSPSEKEPLFEACDEALRATVQALGPRLVIGVGAFAEARCRAALAGTIGPPGEDRAVRVATILHPSPASPAANRGWAEAAERQLLALGVRLPG